MAPSVPAEDRDTAPQPAPDASRRPLAFLIAVLFLAYVLVAMSLPVVPIFVTERLGLSNGWAGLCVGIAFLATIGTRAHAGGLSDRRGAKTAVVRGLAFYAGGALISLGAGLAAGRPVVALVILIGGRLLIGLGESLVAIGGIAWAIGFVGPERSGRVLALVGAAVYAAFALGGPVGLALFDRVGFADAMGISAILPCLGILAVVRMAGVASHPPAERPSFLAVIRLIWAPGAIVGLQGVGFAAISAFSGLYFRHQGWSHAGLGLTAFGAGFVIVRVTLGHLPDRIGGIEVAIGSLAIEAAGQGLLWGAAGPGTALAGIFLTGIGCSLIFPAMGREVVRIVPPSFRGVAIGGFSAFQDLAYGLTGPLAGLLADREGYGGVFLIGGAAALAGVIAAIALRYRQAMRR